MLIILYETVRIITPEGIVLLEYLSTTDLIIANKGNKPTFINKYRKRVLDITKVLNKLYDKITQWKLLDNDSLSDHRYISFTYLSLLETQKK